MLTGLLGLLGIIPAALNTINGITNAIANERIALINAKTEQERIQIQERINALTARSNVLIAESRTPSGIWNARMRFFMAIGPAAVMFKLLFWDKVVGSLVGCSGVTAPGTCGIFITDPLDAHQWYAITAAICFYFAADAYSNK